MTAHQSEEIERLATEAIENQLAYYSGDVVLDAETFYVPVLRLVAENERLRSALQRLVDLKDGPKDSVYHREKPKAWDAARAALTGSRGGSDGQ